MEPMRWKTIGAALLVVVGIGAAAFAVIGPSVGGTAATQYLTSQATITDVVDEVAATGSVAATTTYSLAFGGPAALATSTASSTATAGASGASVTWTVATVDATPGQAVATGDILATADAANAALDVAVAEAALSSAESRLATDKAGLSAADKEVAKLQVTQAKQSRSQARSSYSNTVDQNNLKLKQANAAVTRARTAYREARDEGQPQTAIDQALSALVQAKDSRASLKLQAAQSNSQSASQVKQAELQVTAAKLAYQQKKTSADAATLATDQVAVAQAQQAVTNAKDALTYTTLVSPVDGVVVAVNITPGLAAPSGAAVTIRSDALEVAASVTESDLPSLALGQEVTVTLAALSIDVTGTVARIDQAPASSSSGVVSYGILVTLADPPTGTVPGMSAEIAVTTASATNVLAVPSIALHGSADGSYYVEVLSDSDQPQSVPVTVGLITSSLAEVTSGIDQGTAVVTGTASARTGTGVSTTTTRGLGGGGGLPGGGFDAGGGIPGIRP